MARFGRTFPIDAHIGFPVKGIGIIYGIPTDYTRTANGSLPADDTELPTVYSAADITTVSTIDGNYVTQTGATTQYVLHQFKNFAGVNSAASFTWSGKVTTAGSAATVSLQVYNHNSNLWETLSSNSSVAADTDFTLTGAINGLTNYKNASNIVSCRVYQRLP